MKAGESFQTIFGNIWEIYYWKYERFIKVLIKTVNFWAKKYFIFKWVRILPETGLYHY